MIRERIKSRNILAIGYNKESRLLEVEFKNGGIYQYFEVPQEEFEYLMSADSIGSYFYHNIRNSYEWEKIYE